MQSTCRCGKPTPGKYILKWEHSSWYNWVPIEKGRNVRWIICIIGIQYYTQQQFPHMVQMSFMHLWLSVCKSKWVAIGALFLWQWNVQELQHSNTHLCAWVTHATSLSQSDNKSRSIMIHKHWYSLLLTPCCQLCRPRASYLSSFDCISLLY